MTFATDFIPLALRTESTVAPLTLDLAVFKEVLSASVAAGNLADFLKKKAAYNKPIDLAKWQAYVADMAKAADYLKNITSQDSFNDANGNVIELDTRIFHGVIGLFTESTELMEAMQTALDVGQWDVVNIKEELGDQEWYKAILVDAIGANMEAIQDRVIEKLRARYPEKYTDEAAINRDLVTERAILEK
jgi:hypothetical protein